MKSLARILLCILVLESLCFGTVFAADEVTFEVYSVTLEEGTCVLSGQVFAENATAIDVRIQRSGGELVFSKSISLSRDGSFEVRAALSPNEYQATFSLNGESKGITFRFADFFNTFTTSKGNYRLTAVVSKADGMSIQGTYCGGEGKEITFVVRNGSGEMVAIEQTATQNGGVFELFIKLPEGSYTLSLGALGDVVAEYPNFVPPVISGTMDFIHLADRLNRFIETIEELITSCDEKGLSHDYETANLEIIKLFKTYVEQEVEFGDISRFGEYNHALTCLYNDCIRNLEAYLDGTKTPKPVPKYAGGGYTLEGSTVKASMQIEGKTQQRPMYFMGYGHFETIKEMIPILPKIGVNVIQMDARMYEVLRTYNSYYDNGTALDNEAKEMGWSINHRYLDTLCQTLALAEEHHVLVDFGFTLHMMPSHVLNMVPEADFGEEGYQFLPYDVNNETIRKAISIYARAVMTAIRSYTSVQSVCLANEPQIFAADASTKGVYIDDWQAYLKSLYHNSISELNTKYGERYKNFEAVTMPTSVEETPLFHDYMNFNEKMLTDFISWLAEQARIAAPNLNYHTKVVQSYYDWGRYSASLQGANQEKLLPNLDLNGTDGNAIYNKRELSDMLAWYDYLISIQDAPIWDTEVHIFPDLEEMNYEDFVGAYSAASIWSGAIHNRGAGIYWLWDRDEYGVPWLEDGDAKKNFMNPNYAFRPAEAAKNAKTMLDVQRLSGEINAVAEEKAKIGILYSKTTLPYTDNMNDIRTAYQNVIFNGQKVGFVTDSNPETIADYELLIVPNCTHVKADMLNAIRDYVANGGHVLIQGSNALKKNEYNKEHTAETVDYIYNKADRTSSIAEKLKAMAVSVVSMVDITTNQPVTNVEWSYTTYQGKKVLNLLNHDRENTKIVKVMVNGMQETDLFELREGKEQQTLTLKPYEPQLVTFGGSRFDLLDGNGAILEADVAELKNGRFRYDGDFQGTPILALYCNNILEQVSMGENLITVSMNKPGNWCLKAMDWNMETLTPYREASVITVEVDTQ